MLLLGQGLSRFPTFLQKFLRTTLILHTKQTGAVTSIKQHATRPYQLPATGNTLPHAIDGGSVQVQGGGYPLGCQFRTDAIAAIADG